MIYITGPLPGDVRDRQTDRQTDRYERERGREGERQR